MFHNTPAPLPVRGQPQPQVDQIFRQLCSLLYRIVELPPVDSLSGSFGPLCVGRSNMTPVGFTSLLFGIASALMLIGSTAFMIGIMMMPLVAMVALIFSFIGIFTNLTGPMIWPWSQSGRLDKNTRNDDYISGM